MVERFSLSDRVVVVVVVVVVVDGKLVIGG
jgi:hypothetical protein